MNATSILTVASAHVPVRISPTAVQRGFGRDRYKIVSFLSPEDREHARAGGLVLFKSSRRSGGNHGTYWRVARPGSGGRFYPRVPTPEQLATVTTGSTH